MTVTNTLSHHLSLDSNVTTLSTNRSEYVFPPLFVGLSLSLAVLLAVPKPPLVGHIDYVAAIGSTTKPINKEWAAMWTSLIPLLTDTSYAYSVLAHTHTLSHVMIQKRGKHISFNVGEVHRVEGGRGWNKAGHKINHRGEREGQLY